MIDGEKVNDAAAEFARTPVSAYRTLVGQARTSGVADATAEMRRQADRALARGSRSGPGSRVTRRTKVIFS